MNGLTPVGIRIRLFDGDPELEHRGQPIVGMHLKFSVEMPLRGFPSVSLHRLKRLLQMPGQRSRGSVGGDFRCLGALGSLAEAMPG